MSQQTSTWATQAAVRPERFVPPLPAGIPITAGQAKARKSERRLTVGLVVLVLFLGLGALVWVGEWFSNYDPQRIDAVVRPAMFAHATFGTRLTATLWEGPRILSIGSSYVEEGVDPPTTCVSAYIYDPRTGAMDHALYGGQYIDCIPGLAYEIPYPTAPPVQSHR
jgi:hypothetical protein